MCLKNTPDCWKKSPVKTDVLTGGGPRFTGVQSGKTVLVADPPDRDVVDIPAILTVGKETVGEVEIPL